MSLGEKVETNLNAKLGPTKIFSTKKKNKYLIKITMIIK